MTYIIAGNFNNTNFLMSDCIAIQNYNETFNEKTFGLKSTPNTYFTLSGRSDFSYIIQLFDEYYFNQGRVIDYENEDIMKELIDLIVNSLSDNKPEFEYDPISRIFFLRNDKVFYYDIFFENNQFRNFTKTIIEPNHYAICLENQQKINEDIDDFYHFCKNKIINYNREIYSLNPKKILDFKNRFSYCLSFNNDISMMQPYNSINEYIDICLYQKNKYDQIT